MSYAIAVAGLAGAGKTTATGFLAALCGGQSIYLGDVVLTAMRARQLPETRESERLVRLALRQQLGPAALIEVSRGAIASYILQRIPVLVDAIFNIEELYALQSILTPHPVHLVRIAASFDTRLHRLKDRPKRPFTRDELRARDETELRLLGTEGVFAAATHEIQNERTMGAFHRSLSKVLKSLKED